MNGLEDFRLHSVLLLPRLNKKYLYHHLHRFNFGKFCNTPTAELIRKREVMRCILLVPDGWWNRAGGFVSLAKWAIWQDPVWSLPGIIRSLPGITTNYNSISPDYRLTSHRPPHPALDQKGRQCFDKKSVLSFLHLTARPFWSGLWMWCFEARAQVGQMVPP